VLLTWRILWRTPSRSAQIVEGSWRIVPIHKIEDGRETIWRYQWTDITWVNANEGWLSGLTASGGPAGDIGRGALLHTTDGGHSWSAIDNTLFPSGRGTFKWGNNADSWDDIGPIQSVQSYRRNLGGGRWRYELWVGAGSGIYRSDDGGRSWSRSTPRPDDPNTPQPFALTENAFYIPPLDEAYATGWLGIAHWSASARGWNVELLTRWYWISGVFAYPGDPAWDVWAVGQAGARSGPLGMIYHRKPAGSWEVLNAEGAESDPQYHGLRDIVLTDFRTGFAVGENGAIIKGARKVDGSWRWVRISSPTTEQLLSVAYMDRTLWIVGDAGTVLASADLGATWQVTKLRDEDGGAPPLARVRRFGDSLWIMGNRAVYKFVAGASK
jgi:photosystem II stability/assembly factor-like uncharacterized protein